MHNRQGRWCGIVMGITHSPTHYQIIIIDLAVASSSQFSFCEIRLINIKVVVVKNPQSRDGGSEESCCASRRPYCSCLSERLRN